MQANKKYHVQGETVLNEDEIKDHNKTFEERGKQLLTSLDAKQEKKNKIVSITPAPNRVLVEVHKEEINKGGTIIIPEILKKLQNKGKIVKCGVATDSKPQLYKVGDIVYFPATASIIPYEENGFAYAVINQYDVYMTADKDDAMITVNEQEAGMKI